MAGQPPPPSAAERKSGASVYRLLVASVVDRIRQHLNGTTPDVSPSEFYNLCLSLARGIDYAVANNEVPYNPVELPELLKQVCSQKSDCTSKSICMVLLLSAKNACNSVCFSEKDAHDLLTLTEEMARNFYSPTDVTIGSSDTIASALAIMNRFYPSFKFGKIFTSLDVKSGYGTHINDFHISKDLSYSEKEKIRLFIARTDNIETSACIISPQQVNFLVNGKAVERRTNCSMDPGPQLPTNVTGMLKYGTNLLQAVGQFDGPCIIIIAFMSVNNEHDHSSLLPYCPPHVTSSDTDSDLIEGPSRISLNCPISQTRIKLPVKGHSCKHLQCFDFNNFLEINLRRPSWRCPHCNHYLCYTDIRLDQTLAKIMEEVAEDIAEVIISADGSWKAVMESNAELTDSPEENLNKEKNVKPEVKCRGTVVDLTEINDEMDITPVCGSGSDDRKPLDSDWLGNSSPATVDTAWLEDSILVRSSSLSPRPSNFGLYSLASSVVSEPDPSGVTPQRLPTPTVSNQDAQTIDGPGYLQMLEAQFLAVSRGGHAASPANPNASEIGYGSIPVLRPRIVTPGTTVLALSRPRTPVTVAQRPRTMANQPIPNPFPNHPSFRPPVQLPQQQPVVRPPPLRPLSPHQPSAAGFSNFSNAHLQLALNRRVSPSPSYATRPAVAGRSSLHQRNNPASIGHTSRPAVPNPTHMACQPSPIIPRQSPVHTHNRAPVTPNLFGNATITDLTPEQNFRPAGRMRGSLSSRPISDGLSHLIIQPTQLARPAGLPAGYSPSTEVSAPPHLQAQNLYPAFGQMNHGQRNH